MVLLVTYALEEDTVLRDHPYRPIAHQALMEILQETVLKRTVCTVMQATTVLVITILHRLAFVLQAVTAHRDPAELVRYQ